MREILFKAKRIDNGEWVEGQYCYMLNPKSENGEPKKHFICNGTNVFNSEIDPETICQYTGLTDKNGVKIFEHDKMMIDKGEEYEKQAKVNYSNGCYVLETKKTWDFLTTNLEYSEVIGNIHDKEK